MVSAPALGAGGREFESPHPDHINPGRDAFLQRRAMRLLDVMGEWGGELREQQFNAAVCTAPTNV